MKRLTLLATLLFSAAAFGQAEFFEPLTAPNGSTSNATYSFNGDENTGMYRVAADSIGFTVGGSKNLQVDNSGTEVEVIGDLSATESITADHLIIDDTTNTVRLALDGDRIFHDTDNDGIKDAGEEYIDATGGGDSVSIDGVGVTDPDFVSTADIDFIDTSNTVTANINASVIDAANFADDDWGDGSISSNSFSLDAGVVNQDELAATITLSDGDYIDLSAIVHDDTGLQGLRLPQIGASPSNPASGEGHVGWDQTNNTLEVYNGSAWSAVGGTSTSGSDNEILTDDGAGGITSESNALFNGNELTVSNTTDAPSNLVATFNGNQRATAVDNDNAYFSFYLDNDVGTLHEAARLVWTLQDVSDGGEDATLKIQLSDAGGAPATVATFIDSGQLTIEGNIIGDALVATSANFSDGNVVNVGTLELDRIEPDIANTAIVVDSNTAEVLQLEDGTNTVSLSFSGDRIFHDTDADGTKDAGEEFIDFAGGSGAFSDAGDPIVQNTTGKDVHIGDGAGTLAGKLEIGGDADQPQLVIEGHSAQNDAVLIIQNDADTEVFGVTVAGVIESTAGAFDGEHIQAGTIDDDSIDFVDVTLADFDIDDFAGDTGDDDDLDVAAGGTGVSTLTDGGVLLGQGTGDLVAMGVLADGEMIVGDGTTDPVAESGATLRTSIGVGTGDSPQFNAIELGHATDTTIARVSAGLVSIEGDNIVDVGQTGTVTSTMILDNTLGLGDWESGTDGELITFDASGDPAYVATGTSGQVLTSNGAGAAPTFQDASGGAFNDAADPIVQNTTTKDVHIGDGAGTLTGKLEIGGDADQPQLVIKAHSTQTDDVLIIQNDADTEVFSISVAGAVTSSTLDTGQGAFELQDASTSAKGLIEVATAAETTTGTDAGRALSPDGLAGSDFGKRVAVIILVDDTTALTVKDGIGDFEFVVPSTLDGYDLVDVEANVFVAGTTGTQDLQIHNVTDTADMLSTKMTIDSTELSTRTAATPSVIDSTADDVSAGDRIRIDSDAIQSTAAQGLTVELTFQLP